MLFCRPKGTTTHERSTYYRSKIRSDSRYTTTKEKERAKPGVPIHIVTGGDGPSANALAEREAKILIKEYRDKIRFAQLADTDTLVDLTNVDESEPTGPAVIEPPQITSLKPLASAGSSVREFPVPLPSGAIASFKIPFPMSEEDFAQYS